MLVVQPINKSGHTLPDFVFLLQGLTFSLIAFIIMSTELIIIIYVVVMLCLWPKLPSLLLMAMFIVNWQLF